MQLTDKVGAFNKFDIPIMASLPGLSGSRRGGKITLTVACSATKCYLDAIRQIKRQFGQSVYKCGQVLHIDGLDEDVMWIWLL